MGIRRIVLFNLGLILACSAGSAAVDLSKVDLRPLLRIHASRTSAQDPANPFPIGNGSFDDLLFISKGGATISVVSEQGGTSPFHARIVRGIGSKQDLAAFKAELTAARIGFQTDCSLSGVVELQSETRGPYEITWYGQGTRRNGFTVVFFGKAEIPPHPLCPPEVRLLLDAIREFVFEVELEPDSEILSSFGQ